MKVRRSNTAIIDRGRESSNGMPRPETGMRISGTPVSLSETYLGLKTFS